MKPSAVLHYSVPFATQALQNITRETRESPLTQDPAVTAVCLHRSRVQAVLACLLAWVGAVGPAVEGRARNLAEDPIEGSATLTPSDSPAGRPSGAPATFVPVVLTSSGRNNSFFTSELTLTNRGDQPATLNYTYTAHIGGGSGTASETLAAGRQKIVPDAIDHLRTLGIPIPNAGNRIGTLRVAIAGSSRVGVMVRTTTRVADGRAGLAFPGVAVGFEEAVYLCGLRQNRQDRSNVAFQNMGTQGEITLRTTVYSGEAGDSGFRVLEAVTLAPGGFYQYSGLLATAGFTQGYVKVERVKGTAPFYAYGVINDQANSDGAFVFPVTASALRGIRGQTLPVIVETGVFASELMVTNFSKEAKTVTFRFRAEAIRTPDKTASLEWNFPPGKQIIVPNAVETMRRMGLPKIGPPGPAFAGALDATVARGDMSGIVIGARTGTSGGGGQYGVFYNAVPYGDAFIETAWVDALQQNEENRSNLALVTTAEVDNSPSVFTLEIYDGTTGMLASTVTGIRVPARGWRQINGILDNHAPGVTQGYVLIRKTSGNNPFLAYGVINDGGSPGQRSGDGAYLAASGARERSIDPGTEAMANREVLEALYHATGGPGWSDRTNWLSSAPLSEWFGVETDSRGRVTSLSLEGNQLSGAIPAELGDLDNLQWLDLGFNLNLSGAIPAQLGDLGNLQSLDLWGNQLSGTIPPELGDLGNLQWLDLADNQLSGTIPPELGELDNLQWLSLAYNQLSGTIPPELAELDNLQWLSLWGNQLSGAIPPELAELDNLYSLNLADNHLRGTIPAKLGELDNLQWLSLWGNQLSGAIPPELGELDNLYSLALGFNLDLTGTIPTQLQQLPLSTLELMATAVCVPEDMAFQDWLRTIESFLPSGLVCGRPPDPMPSIDVAVFFTPAARRKAGGKAEMEALIDLMVVETNQAYEDSGANQRIVLAAREEVPYEEENGSGSLALDRLVAKSDGYMDEVHTIRDRTGADLVHLIADVTDVGGIANMPGAFGLTCAHCSSKTFAHELGHNMGLAHDRYVDRGLLPYSHGYVNQQAFAEDAPESARWFTIMAYQYQCGDAGFSCEWILRFSNPNQTYRGDPLGVPGEELTAVVDGPADAVRTLNLTRHSVASFRHQAPENRQMLSSTLSPAPSVIRTGQAPAPLPGGGLFRPLAPNPAAAALQRDGRRFDPAPLRRRQVSVDTTGLARLPDSGPAALVLNLFDDFIVTGIIQRRTPTYSGGYALSGRLAAVPGGTVTLVVNGSVVAGTVRLPGAVYRIRPTGGGSHAIVQIDPSQSSWRCGTESRPH